jgi:hypothetical protein
MAFFEMIESLITIVFRHKITQYELSAKSFASVCCEPFNLREME